MRDIKNMMIDSCAFERMNKYLDIYSVNISVNISV